MAFPTLQAISQRRVAMPVHHMLDGETNGFGWSDQHRQAPGSRGTSVHQIATEEHVVLHEQGKITTGNSLPWLLWMVTAQARASSERST